MIKKDNHHLYISDSEYQQRRQRLLDQMQDNSIAIVFAGSEVVRSNDTEYQFRQNSDFFYLTGFEEPDAVLVLSNQLSIEGNDKFSASNVKQSCSIMFVRPKNSLAEIWHGRRLGVDAAPSSLNVDLAFSIEQLPVLLPDLLDGHENLYFEQGREETADCIVKKGLFTCKKSPKQTKTAPQSVIDISQMIHQMRLIKSNNEIEIMKRSALISCEAHKQAMRICRPGVYEYQLEAHILYCFGLNGASSAAYNSIVGGGENACILHYTENKDLLNDNDLVLIDAGCEYNGYAADITRTFPVNGTFSQAQRDIYELVLSVQKSCIEQLTPNTTIAKVMELAVDSITEGLIKLGIMKGNKADCIKAEAHKEFFMHGLGHYLGIDVHDVGNYKEKGKEVVLQPGMVITVEPGIYISSSSDVPDKYKGIGVRIEDDILITKDGNINLTAKAPKEINDIENTMRQKLAISTLEF